MVTILLTDTDPEIEALVHDAEAMCHEAGIGVIVHYKGEDLDEILEMADSKLIAFSPRGRLSLDEMVAKYGDDALLVIGGFTEDMEFKSPIYNRADDTVSLGKEFLEIPEVIDRIIIAYKKRQ